MNILIPAAGLGTRFIDSKYKLPKPNILVNGLPMLVAAAKSLRFIGTYIFVIRENEYRESLAKHIFQNFPLVKVAVIDFDTDGAAETALIAEDLIKDKELILTNCDQIMDNDWNPDIAIKQLRKYDGGVVTVDSSDSKHSYAAIENNLVRKIEEKNIISDKALTGLHYWKNGTDFIDSAKDLMSKDYRTLNEFYIGPTYNVLIGQNKKIGFHNIPNNQIHFIGTPEDLELYESRQTE